MSKVPTIRQSIRIIVLITLMILCIDIFKSIYKPNIADFLIGIIILIFAYESATMLIDDIRDLFNVDNEDIIN